MAAFLEAAAELEELGYSTIWLAGGPLDRLGRGFTEDDITQLSDRLVDAIVTWGDVDTIVARVSEHQQAGANQVALGVLSASPPVAQWRRLAEALIP